MKAKKVLLGIFILGIGLALTGCASTEGSHDERLDKSEQLDSMGHHAPVIESAEARIAILEDKIMNLQERIAVFTKKQYLDPHEFRLSGWEVLKRDYQKQVEELRTKIAELRNTHSQQEGMGKVSNTVLFKVA